LKMRMGKKIGWVPGWRLLGGMGAEKEKGEWRVKDEGGRDKGGGVEGGLWGWEDIGRRRGWGGRVRVRGGVGFRRSLESTQ